MLCQECRERQASVHLTKIINNYKTEIHLCEECARHRDDVNAITPFSVNDLLAGFMDIGKSHLANEKVATMKCSACGTEYMAFKKNGQLGCKHCYHSFNRELMPILRKVQGRTEHTGKVPRRSGIGIRMRKQMNNLRVELKKAVEAEAFEQAAEIRDHLKELEQQWAEGGGEG